MMKESPIKELKEVSQIEGFCVKDQRRYNNFKDPMSLQYPSFD